MLEVPLGGLLEAVIDHRGKTPKKLGGEFVDSGIPVVSAIHIKGERIVWEQRARFVTPEMFARWMPVRLAKGDVLLTSEAPLGETALVPSSDDLVLSQRLFALRGKQGELDSAYLRYFLASSVGQERLQSRATGTTVTGIRQSELMKVLVPLPAFEEQRRIAAVLSMLDDLVELNQRIALSSEALAIALVQQAPTQVALREYGEVAKHRAVPPAGSTDHFSLPAFDVDRLPERVDGAQIKSNKTRLHDPVVLVSRLNPHIPRVWMAYPREGVASFASTEFVPLQGLDAAVEEIWAVCANPSYLEAMSGLVTGTTGSHQRVDKEALIALPVPDVRLLTASARESVVQLVQEAHASRVLVRQLVTSRDELLPLLLSGRLSAREAVAV